MNGFPPLHSSGFSQAFPFLCSNHGNPPCSSLCSLLVCYQQKFMNSRRDRDREKKKSNETGSLNMIDSSTRAGFNSSVHLSASKSDATYSKRGATSSMLTRARTVCVLCVCVMSVTEVICIQRKREVERSLDTEIPIGKHSYTLMHQMCIVCLVAVLFAAHCQLTCDTHTHGTHTT